MTTLAYFLAAYLTGIGFLVVLDIRNVVYLEPMARAAWCVVRAWFRPAPYVGRHRTEELSTSERNVALAVERERLVAENRAVVAALREPTQEMVVPDFPGECGYGPGSSHYQLLRKRVLDAQVSVDLKALRLKETVEREVVGAR